MEMTKVVNPFIRKGVTQYFWQYGVFLSMRFVVQKYFKIKVALSLIVLNGLKRHWITLENETLAPSAGIWNT